MHSIKKKLIIIGFFTYKLVIVQNLVIPYTAFMFRITCIMFLASFTFPLHKHRWSAFLVLCLPASLLYLIFPIFGLENEMWYVASSHKASYFIYGIKWALFILKIRCLNINISATKPINKERCTSSHFLR